MYCRSRPHYRSDLGWILGVAFEGTLTRSARPAQGFTCVRCCSTPKASSPHGLAARAVAFSWWLLPPRSPEDLPLLPRVHAWHTFAAAPRNDNLEVGEHMFGFSESLHEAAETWHTFALTRRGSGAARLVWSRIVEAVAQEVLPGGGTKRVGDERKDFQYVASEAAHRMVIMVIQRG